MQKVIALLVVANPEMQAEAQKVEPQEPQAQTAEPQAQTVYPDLSLPVELIERIVLEETTLNALLRMRLVCKWMKQLADSILGDRLRQVPVSGIPLTPQLRAIRRALVDNIDAINPDDADEEEMKIRIWEATVFTKFANQFGFSFAGNVGEELKALCASDAHLTETKSLLLGCAKDAIKDANVMLELVREAISYCADQTAMMLLEMCPEVMGMEVEFFYMIAGRKKKVDKEFAGLLARWLAAQQPIFPGAAIFDYCVETKPRIFDEGILEVIWMACSEESKIQFLQNYDEEVKSFWRQSQFSSDWELLFSWLKTKIPGLESPRYSFMGLKEVVHSLEYMRCDPERVKQAIVGFIKEEDTEKILKEIKNPNFIYRLGVEFAEWFIKTISPCKSFFMRPIPFVALFLTVNGFKMAELLATSYEFSLEELVHYDVYEIVATYIKDVRFLDLVNAKRNLHNWYREELAPARLRELMMKLCEKPGFIEWHIKNTEVPVWRQEILGEALKVENFQAADAIWELRETREDCKAVQLKALEKAAVYTLEAPSAECVNWITRRFFEKNASPAEVWEKVNVARKLAQTVNYVQLPSEHHQVECFPSRWKIKSISAMVKACKPTREELSDAFLEDLCIMQTMQREDYRTQLEFLREFQDLCKHVKDAAEEIELEKLKILYFEEKSFDKWVKGYLAKKSASVSS